MATWQVWSDKYFNETIARVKIDVEVAPPPSDFAGSAGDCGVATRPYRLTWGASNESCLIRSLFRRCTDPDQERFGRQIHSADVEGTVWYLVRLLSERGFTMNPLLGGEHFPFRGCNDD